MTTHTEASGGAYYNEIDPYAAEWLRNLVAEGLIAPGDVDERSIKDVRPDELRGYKQVHLFAGVGGWSLALRLAGWPDDREVWTGSCPCQPFSSAGRREAGKDARHLWPWMRHLIFQCRPAVAFGEQVASKAGRAWLAGVRANLEALGYGVGAADLCAAGIGAPHIRQRLFWVADAGCSGDERELRHRQAHGADGAVEGEAQQRERGGADAGGGGAACGLADAGGAEPQGQGGADQAGREAVLAGSGRAGGLEHAAVNGRDARRAEPVGGGASRGCSAGRLVHPIDARPQGHPGHGDDGNEPGRLDAQADGPPPPAGAWSDFELVHCTDGKSRRVESGSFPLAHGLPRSVGPGSPWLGRLDELAAARAGLKRAKRNRIGRLMGYGNAIVPELAAEFIAAWLSVASANPTQEL